MNHWFSIWPQPFEPYEGVCLASHQKTKNICCIYRYESEWERFCVGCNVLNLHFTLIPLSEMKGLWAVHTKYFNLLDWIFLSFSDPDCWECSSKEKVCVKVGRMRYRGIKRQLTLWICNPCECGPRFWRRKLKQEFIQVKQEEK